MRLSFLLLAVFLTWSAHAQFAPQAGQPGSTAIPAGSPLIKGWATRSTVTLGWLDIRNKSLGTVAFGLDTNGTGPADGTLVSLGDSGVVVLEFAVPIADGPGADLAVFENGFLNPADSQQAYLELAFVEVSSDGSHFFRFPVQALADTTAQVAGTGTYLDCRKYHNLAGTYRSGFGTPFDLSDLPNHVLLNKSRITHVRLVDVIGSIGPEGSRDAAGRKINDPFPTAFNTGGFDLDGVAVLHDETSQRIQTLLSGIVVRIAPNPATDWLSVDVPGIPFEYELLHLDGRPAASGSAEGQVRIPVAALPEGLYWIQLKTREGESWCEKIWVR
ncbi:MAG: T9SS type A sorting domain-containing protein [Sphingobacteriales bacterium]|nr:MAG: T9SS type A sorting domain-containing protein [Sphingobacteriales bacterium]